MQKCFDEKNIQMLQEAISKMDPMVCHWPLYCLGEWPESSGKWTIHGRSVFDRRLNDT